MKVHEDAVKRLTDCHVDGFGPVGRRANQVTPAREEECGDVAIDAVVVGNQEAERPRIFRSGREIPAAGVYPNLDV